MKYIIIPALFLLVAGCITEPGAPEPNEMTFFITSKGSGIGANLGGLAEADSICQNLGESAGSTKTWRAYLSVQG